MSSGLLQSCEESFFQIVLDFTGGGAIFVENFKRSMKKFIFALSCAAMMLVCGCSKESHGDQNHVTCPVESDWSGLVKAHPLFVGFPEFTGRIQNPLYSDLGDGRRQLCSSSIIVKRMSRLIIARDLHLSGSQRMIPGNIQRSLMESPIFSPVLIRQAVLDLIFT